MATIDKELEHTEEVSSTQSMSYEAYLELPDDVQAEWKDGEVILLMLPKRNHQRVVRFLSRLIEEYVQLLDLGEVGIAPFEVRLTPQGPSREPDLFFVATASLERMSNDRFEGGPDLVIEVISRESIGRDRGDKFYEYQEAGVREYWIIDSRPGKGRADFYVLDATGRYQAMLPDSQGRIQSQVIPGFFIQLDWLWQDPAPSIFMVLPQLAAANPDFAQALNGLGKQ